MSLNNATQNIKDISLVVSDKKILKFKKIYFCPCDLDIPFDQLFERATLKIIPVSQIVNIQAIILGGNIF